ncbi:MAG: hypothetical protein AAF587_01400 [Bacteroidota bacterium]
MRKQLSLLLNLLLSPSPSREKQGLIIFISFFLALILWILVTLTQEYPSTLNYPIRITEVPETLDIQSVTPSIIEIKASGSGIELIGKHFRFGQDTILFPYVSDFSEKGYTESGSFQKVMQDKVGSDLKVISFWPGRIDVETIPKTRKLVPLINRTKISLRPAYQLDTPPELSVDSVYIIGPESVIDTIEEWFTGPEEKQVFSDDTSIVVKLMSPKEDFQITPQVVRLSVRTSLYTETKIPVSVSVVDQPGNVSVRLNYQEITLTCLVPFNEYERMLDNEDDFRAEIPYDRLDPEFAKIIPDVSLPTGVKLIRQEPKELSFVIISL